MATVVHMASYPARQDIMLTALDYISPQVDYVNLVLNGYDAIPDSLLRYHNVRCLIPENDLKDTGKFYPDCHVDDFVFLCDDDIIYPSNYVEKMKQMYLRYDKLNAVIGLHGIIYPFYFNGHYITRKVADFSKKNKRPYIVHQLGTGTILCKGYQMPDYDYTEHAKFYVDLCFAQHCYDQNYPLICIERSKNWLQTLSTSDSIFMQFTKRWPSSLTSQARELAQMKRIDISGF